MLPAADVEKFTTSVKDGIDMRDTLTVPWIESRYEELVSDFEPNARRLVEALGLDWDPAVLEFTQQTKDRLISTPSYLAVTEKVHTKAIGRWKNYEKQMGAVGGVLAPFVEAFGYE